MSSTSSGLLCKIAAASLKVTPSKLVLLREMRRPPEQINHPINVTGCHGQSLALAELYASPVAVVVSSYLV